MQILTGIPNWKQVTTTNNNNNGAMAIMTSRGKNTCYAHAHTHTHHNGRERGWMDDRIEYSHRLVLVLYKIRNPHCRQRTGSPPLIKFRAPQSPHRYSTPRIAGIPMAMAEDAGLGFGLAALLPPPPPGGEFILWWMLLLILLLLSTSSSSSRRDDNYYYDYEILKTAACVILW